jgi:hypothetical protein
MLEKNKENHHLWGYQTITSEKMADSLFFLVLTSMQSGVLLDVRELLEAAIAVAALVGLLACVHPDVLHQLVVGAERLEALLTLVRLDLGPCARHEGARAAPGRLNRLPRVHLHRRLVHEDLMGDNRTECDNFCSHF